MSIWLFWGWIENEIDSLFDCLQLFESRARAVLMSGNGPVENGFRLKLAIRSKWCSCAQHCNVHKADSLTSAHRKYRANVGDRANITFGWWCCLLESTWTRKNLFGKFIQPHFVAFFFLLFSLFTFFSSIQFIHHFFSHFIRSLFLCCIGALHAFSMYVCPVLKLFFFRQIPVENHNKHW